MHATENHDPTAKAPATGSLLKRVPGRARAQKKVREEFEKDVEEMRQRYERALWPLLIPNAGDIFRWRVQLECGCTHELLTREEDEYPDGRSYRDPMTGRRLPVGEYWCPTDHGSTQKPYRDIVEWGDRKILEFPADSEESEYDWMDAETWAKIRKPEPHSSMFWQVKLACGHYGQVCTDMDWKPEDGPKKVSEERITQMRRDFEELWAAEEGNGRHHEDPEREHIRKMLDLRWPRPETELDCYTCTNVRRITGYQRIGWLVPKAKPATAQVLNTDREKVAVQLAAAETEVRRLRKQLEATEEA
ncbi:hypothetical protein ACFY5D_21595 [Paeniglutamicibacter sp. NPDC012692]|uniref:hypothetical protein n=1 Tax=Paeniglutamicibacter sp. NPDC012692 TaxID=3364388 RepID=UPI0036865732